MLRILLILSLLVQQLALPAVVSSAVRMKDCVKASCCQVVETKMCCGETVSEMQCSKTGGQECVCGLEPGDSEPVPQAPRPSDRHDLAPMLVAFIGCGIDPLAAARLQAPPASPAIVRTHNETQALLCIWRT